MDSNWKKIHSNSRQNRKRNQSQDENLFRSKTSSSRRHRISSRHNYDSDSDTDCYLIEQKILDQVINIERRKEILLRRQFEYLVSNIQKLERRRFQLRQSRWKENFSRTNSSSISRDSSTDQLSSLNQFQKQSEKDQSRWNFYQITMIYRENQTDDDDDNDNGDDICIFHDENILFRGIIRYNEKLIFQINKEDIKSDHQHEKFRLLIKINEKDSFSIRINLEKGIIYPDNNLFQIDQIRKFRNLSNNRRNKHRKLSKISNEYETHQKSSSRRRLNSDQDQTKENHRSKSEQNKNSFKKNDQPIKRSTIKELDISTSNKQKSKEEAQTIDSSTKQQKSIVQSNEHSNDDETYEIDDQNQNENNGKKGIYGPPQVSTLRRSNSDSSSTNLESKNFSKLNDQEINFQLSENQEKSKENDKNEKESDDEPNADRFPAFLQLLQALSSGGVAFDSSNDENDQIQSFISRLGINIGIGNQSKRKKFTPRLKGNIENFLLIYLNSSTMNSTTIEQCRALVNFFETFHDPDDCLAFINSIVNENILLIVSDHLGDPFVSKVQDLQQIKKIYVLCENEDQVENWSTNQPKIAGIFLHLENIIQNIENFIEQEEKNLLSFSITSTNINQKEESEFLIHLILKDILLDQDEVNESKKELIDFLREEYENNAEQLKMIQLFEINYQKENSVEFYHQKSFLFKMLNKAFRTMEIDILFKLRLFIQHLHQSISNSSKIHSIKTVYRSQMMNQTQFESLKKHLNNHQTSYILFSNFFQASIDQPDDEKENFSNKNDDETDDDNHHHDEKEQKVLFQIDLENNENYMIYQGNVLFSFCLVGQLLNLTKDKNGQTKVHLKLIPFDNEQLENLVEPMRKEIRAPYPSLRIVKLFIELDEYSKAIYLGQKLLAEYDGSRKDCLLALARLYHGLGTTLYEKEEYDQALDVIQKSHELYLRFLPEDAPQLSPTWNNMGSIYLKQGKTDLALEYHERALAIQLKSPSPDLPSIISYSNNIGGVYLKLERYDEALHHFQRALLIEEQTLPKNHPELAGTYHRIGGVYFKQNNHQKALEYYDKTLEIELASLPDNHPTVAVTYHNRGTALEGLGRLEEALESAEKAVQRLLKTLPKENPQVRMNQTYADRLKQKLWVKQLFSS